MSVRVLKSSNSDAAYIKWFTVIKASTRTFGAHRTSADVSSKARVLNCGLNRHLNPYYMYMSNIFEHKKLFLIHLFEHWTWMLDFFSTDNKCLGWEIRKFIFKYAFFSGGMNSKFNHRYPRLAGRCDCLQTSATVILVFKNSFEEAYYPKKAIKFHTVVKFTDLCLMTFPILIDWTNPFQI